jgi:hypothetical protein
VERGIGSGDRVRRSSLADRRFVGLVDCRGLAGCVDLADHRSRRLGVGLVSDGRRAAAAERTRCLRRRLGIGSEQANLCDTRLVVRMVGRRRPDYLTTLLR